MVSQLQTLQTFRLAAWLWNYHGLFLRADLENQGLANVNTFREFPRALSEARWILSFTYLQILLNMSSPAADSRGRPMSENSASSPSRATFKTFGQEYQYAETLQNPFPEVIFSGPANTATSAASTSPAAVGGIDGTNDSPADNDTRSSLRFGTPGSKEPAMHEDVWVEPAEAPWYKTISRGRWAAIIICTVGITGVVLAILGAMNKLSGERSDSSDPSPDFPTPIDMSADQASSSNTPSPAESTSATPTTLVTSTTSGNAKPQTPPTTKIDCHDPSSFLTPISWIGTTVGAYKTEFAFDRPTSRLGLLQRVPGPRRGRADKGDAKSCPRGRAATTFFLAGVAEDGSNGTAGMGPCALEGHVA
ncbi:predicted protein [Chaetomium globosum CBS 148.51]|uniref:Uncharacterized protein n=1 Tax=Chaetomium globosum (strain ATCC 6205 / CBS 148.51 / DSM 1962 / NBRC 6347 / NRRL 1970) TaxID=306901 RepID=Q2H5C2_CHAGB|nr:uncharacterized protein CHGG_06143 [Chaetomium globosum CBS 148.51]EAQ89524.1 predicted protein [Chaetomium globosum CBS 148.51]